MNDLLEKQISMIGWVILCEYKNFVNQDNGTLCMNKFYYIFNVVDVSFYLNYNCCKENL